MHRLRSYILPIILVVAFFYPIVEVFFTKFPDFTFTHYLSSENAEKPIATYLMSVENFYVFWIITASLCIAFRCGVIIHGYFASVRRFGEERFRQQFALHFLSFVVGFGFGLLLLLLVAVIAVLSGFSFGGGFDVFSHIAQWMHDVIYIYVPTIFPVQSYLWAVFLTIVFASLPTYVIHWLSHQSRLMWYVFHRPHHTPEILHPLAAAPAFMFEFVMVLPNVLIVASISKLFSHQPLIMEAYIFFVLGYFMEIFNHSAAHYEFAYRNPIIRNLCRLTGDTGVYHLMHHSAAATDQMINLSGGPFNFWDRLFGTYKKPYPHLPDLGLTNVPKIIYNPFAIIFSGMRQIWYELRMNRGFGTRLRILFGSVYYKPPISKEFLILDKN